MSLEAKDKADELIEKFGIEKAILCVDEILIEIQKVFSPKFAKKNPRCRFYQQVKQEILKHK